MPIPTLVARCAAVPVAIAALLAGCSTPPPVGAVPSPSVPIPAPTNTPDTRDTAEAYKLEVSIDLKTVTPLRQAVALARGRTVLLTFNSDHDVEVTMKGAGIDKTVFVARQTEIVSSFVVNEVGVVTVRSADPDAIIAELTVS